jgi:hypothetical protein
MIFLISSISCRRLRAILIHDVGLKVHPLDTSAQNQCFDKLSMDFWWMYGFELYLGFELSLDLGSYRALALTEF